MVNKIKTAFEKNNLIITIPMIVILLLLAGNGYLMCQNQQVQQKTTTQNAEIKKVSNDFATKYKKIAKKAKQEFKVTHTDPLNQ